MKYDQGWKELQISEDNIDKGVAYAILSLLGSLALITLLFGGCVDGVVETTQNRERIGQQIFTQEQQEYVNFFKKHNSPVPEQMAMAVTATKRPALMAAIAVVESNGDPKAVGDKGKSKGAFQVQEKHWGEVSSDPVKQALHAERILEELLSSRRALWPGNSRLRVALARYNGGERPPRVSYRYADKVMRIAK